MRAQLARVVASAMETNKNIVFKMADEEHNSRWVKRKLSIVGLLQELISNSDDDSEEYDDDFCMELAIDR